MSVMLLQAAQEPIRSTLLTVVDHAAQSATSAPQLGCGKWAIPFPKSTPEESDGFQTLHENRPDSHISGENNPAFLLPFHPVSHCFSLPVFPPTNGEIGGVETFLLGKGE